MGDDWKYAQYFDGIEISWFLLKDSAIALWNVLCTVNNLCKQRNMVAQNEDDRNFLTVEVIEMYKKTAGPVDYEEYWIQ